MLPTSFEPRLRHCDVAKAAVGRQVAGHQSRSLWRGLLSVATVVVLPLPAWLGSVDAHASACPFCTGVAEPISSQVSLHDFTSSARVTGARSVIRQGLFSRQVTYELLTPVFVHSEVTPPRSPVMGIGTGTEVVGEQRVIVLSRVSGGETWEVYKSWPDAEGRIGEYLTAKFQVMKPGTQRRDHLAFLAPRLEAEDDAVRDDVLSTFREYKAEEIRKHRDVLPVASLRQWLVDETIPASRRQLHAFLLGLCGEVADGEVVRQQLEQWRHDCDPAAAVGFFTAYALLDAKRGKAYLLEAMADTKADVVFRTHAVDAVSYLAYMGDAAEVLAAYRPSLRKLLDDRLLAADVLRLWRRLPDVAALGDARVWYERNRERLKGDEHIDLKLAVVQFAAAHPSEHSKRIIEMLREDDPDLMSDPVLLALPLEAQPQDATTQPASKESTTTGGTATSQPTSQPVAGQPRIDPATDAAASTQKAVPSSPESTRQKHLPVQIGDPSVD